MDAATAFAATPLPRGRRVAIISGPGGMGVGLTDACADAGLELARLSPETVAALSERVPGVGTSFKNPIDLGMWPRSRPELYRVATECIAQDPGLDAILVVTKPDGSGNWAETIFAALPTIEKPVVAVVAGLPATVAERVPVFLEARMVPFSDSRRAARAIGWLHQYGEFLRRVGRASQAAAFAGCRL